MSDPKASELPHYTEVPEVMALCRRQQERIQNLEEALVGLRNEFRTYVHHNRAALNAAGRFVKCR